MWVCELLLFAISQKNSCRVICNESLIVNWLPIRFLFTVQFGMSTNQEKQILIHIQFFKYNSNISCHVEASPPIPSSLETVVVEKRMERFFHENVASFTKCFLVRRTKFLKSLLELPMKMNGHFAPRYASISFPVRNAGEIFFPVFMSRSARAIRRSSFLDIGCACGSMENTTFLSRTTCRKYAFKSVLKGNPRPLATFCASRLTLGSVLIVIMLVFIYL